MNLEISHREARQMFFAAIDEELPNVEEEKLFHHLEGCDDCRVGWEKYAKAVGKVRSLERVRAPASLSTMILRRVRRRRSWTHRKLAQAHAHHRLPAEVLIPLLLAVAVATLLVALAP